MTRDTPADDENSWSHGFDRRSMLLALGAGSGLALTGRYGVRAQDDGDADEVNQTGGQRCEPCIDQYAGYWQPGETKEQDQQPEGINPVTTVELRVTNADVVFPDEEPQGGMDAGNETVGNDTEPTNVSVGNQTGGPMGNETAVEGAGPPGEAGGFPDFYFDPVGIHLQPGDTVEFLTMEELHTVTAFHPRYRVQQRIPDGAPGFTSPPVLSEDSWYYRFDESGVYDLLCLPHLELGMVMRVVVAEEGGDVPEAPSDPQMTEDPPADEQPEAAPDMEETEESYVPRIALRVLNAPELEPQNVVDQGPVAWTDLSGVASEPPTGF